VAEILVAGCGYVGAALASLLAVDGHRVFGLRRRPEALPAGVVPVAADLADLASLRGALAEAGADRIDALVYAAAADRSDDASYRAAYVTGLRNALAAVAANAPRQVFFTSSTAVYAQRRGEWVDESSATEPTHWSGLRMLEAERLLVASGLPVAALRLGGIYGPGRTRLVERVRSGQAAIRPGPPRYTNRIHRDDAAGALRHLLALALAGKPLAPVYVGVDDEPADEAKVLRWLSGRLGVPLRAAAGDEALASAREASARSEAESSQPSEVNRRAAAQQPDRPKADSNKRCLNARLRATGYRLRHPTFREGYAALLAAPQ
jgi:nucleoside-diphosphate-sugar epimerase